MPRSSRHKSHRSHKHSSRDARDRSDSEDDLNSKHRKQRVEESSSRVSKEKSSSSLLSSQERSKGVIENGDCLVEHGRKRKERGDGCVTPDRWNGSGKDDGLVEKSGKDESFGLLDAEKGEKSKLLSVESKSRSGGRRSESLKRRSEKDCGRREIREERERDVERVSESEKDKEREKRVVDGRHGKSDDVETRNQGCRRGGGGGGEEERLMKKDSTGKVT